MKSNFPSFFWPDWIDTGWNKVFKVPLTLVFSIPNFSVWSKIPFIDMVVNQPNNELKEGVKRDLNPRPISIKVDAE